MLARTAFAAVALWTATAAVAGDGASPKPPAPPAVDFSDLAPSASQRPKNGDGSAHQLEAHLLTDVSTVKPGDTFRVGLKLDQDEHWHTYWKSPGEIGLPTDITLGLPDGFVQEPMGVLQGGHEYPVPQRFEDPEAGIISAGYEDEVLQISTVTVPADAAPGEHPITMDAGWLICKTSCIPGSVTLSSTVTVADTTSPSPFASTFDHYQAQHPVDPATVKSVAFEAVMNQTAVRAYDAVEFAILVTPTGDAKLADPASVDLPAFFPYASMSAWYLERPVVEFLDDGRLLVKLKGEAIAETPVENDRVGGLFQLKVGEEWVRTEVTIPVKWLPEGATIEKTSSPLFDLGSTETTTEEGTSAPEGGTDATDASPSNTSSDDAGPKIRSVLPAGDAPADQSFLQMLLFAFLGGAILNIMPCVFPVLTIKLFGLVSHAADDPAAQKRSGLAYTAGIVVSFWALAAGVLLLKTGASGAGWGFQMQSPTYIAVLTAIVFAFGLSMFGVFEIPAIGADAASDAQQKSGIAGDFFNGVFATLVATPCTAPFLGPAIGFAFTLSAPFIVLFFTMVGLGLAAPFLLVAFVPALYRLLPQPGAWMETFKQFMGFTMMATAVWLVDILSAQIGTDGAIGFLAFLTTVGLGCWIFGTWGGLGERGWRQIEAAVVAVTVIAFGAWMFVDLSFAPAEICDDGSLSIGEQLDFSEEVPWQGFSERRVAELDGNTIFIDFTADWCLSCKVNEQTVLETQDVRDAFKKFGVVPLQGDYTRQDPVIAKWLTRFQRPGVPFYLVITETGEYIPLPEVLTKQMVIDAITPK